jgi:hypothetical protein
MLTKQNPTLPRRNLDIQYVGMHAVRDNASIDLASGRDVSRSGGLIAELWRLTACRTVSLTSAAQQSTTVLTL